MNRKKLLFVSSEKADLKLTGEEHQVIRDAFPDNHKDVHAIREAYVSFRELFNLLENNQSKIQDIEFLQFSGHSGKEGMLFSSDASLNQDGRISVERFKELISVYPNLKVIILNSCSSDYIGKQLRELTHIETVIETTGTVYERDAILFSKLLFQKLNNGDTIRQAFGKVKISFEIGNIQKEERGNKREVFGRTIKNEKFPWQIYVKEGSEWSLTSGLDEKKEEEKEQTASGEKTISQIKNLIAQAKIKPALKAMSGLAENQDDSDMQNTILLFQGRYTRLEKQYNGGVLSQADYRIELNRITHGILSILDDMEEA